MMQHNCPVCNKVGLPDYRVIPTICPQCNSDLKPFLLLHSIEKPNSNKKTIFGFIALVLTAIVFVSLYFNESSEKRKLASENSNIIFQLQDSIHNLQTAIAKQQLKETEIETSEKEVTIQYKVKKDDYPSKIAQFFYNDWRMYKQIETDNDLHQPYILKVGQTLKIKIKQQ